MPTVTEQPFQGQTFRAIFTSPEETYRSLMDAVKVTAKSWGAVGPWIYVFTKLRNGSPGESRVYNPRDITSLKDFLATKAIFTTTMEVTLLLTRPLTPVPEDKRPTRFDLEELV